MLKALLDVVCEARKAMHDIAVLSGKSGQGEFWAIPTALRLYREFLKYGYTEEEMLQLAAATGRLHAQGKLDIKQAHLRR